MKWLAARKVRVRPWRFEYACHLLDHLGSTCYQIIFTNSVAELFVGVGPCLAKTKISGGPSP
jgi:hypothetical protein